MNSSEKLSVLGVKKPSEGIFRGSLDGWKLHDEANKQMTLSKV